MIMVEIKNISFKDTVNVLNKMPELKDITLKPAEGKITSFIAPKNSGKSLLLKITAGLKNADSGEILNSTGGKIIYLPGKPASFPWLNVYENVSFGIKNINESEIKKIIGIAGLEGYEKHFAHSTSLGFRFRISLARSLAHNPALILLDEPFGKMDDITKMEVYGIIRDVSKNQKISFLCSSSNVTESIYLSDKIYLMKANPLEVFHEEEIKFGRERKASTLKSERFIQLCGQIVNQLKTEDPQNLFNISI
jgi:NitT/TauT family transport system ATP-binding protein